jgi:hypothetical protein
MPNDDYVLMGREFGLQMTPETWDRMLQCLHQYHGLAKRREKRKRAEARRKRRRGEVR